MIYSEKEARALVLEACKTLVDEELIARTWGNVSARIGEDEFIITPSGKAYQGMKESDLVKVKASDLSYEGDIKPSSEKGIHAAVYLLHKDVGFVIHTHQLYASVVSILGKDTDFAPCADYGLPGTPKLWKQVSACMNKHLDSEKFLLQRHGALCFGSSMENAFDNVRTLEKESKALFEKNKVDASDRKKTKAFIDDYAQIMGPHMNPVAGEDAQAVCLISEKNALAACYTKDAKPMGFFDVRLQNYIYKNKYSKLRDGKK